MLVTVPFSDFGPIGVTKIFENIKLVVEIVEDDDFRVIFHDLQHGHAAGLVRIHHAAPVHTKLRSRFNRTVFPRVPAVSRNIFVERNVVGNRHILMMRCGVPLELHRHKNAIAQTDQPSGVEVSVNLWILRPPVINHMLVDEIGLVPVEPICDEDGDIILPGIPRGS